MTDEQEMSKKQMKDTKGGICSAIGSVECMPVEGSLKISGSG